MSYQLAIQYLPWALTGIFLLLNLYLIFRPNSSKQPENTERNEHFEEFRDQLDGYQDELFEIAKQFELLETKFVKLELEGSELYEFVNRNIKKMSTRAQRAEALNELVDQAKAIEGNPEEQADLFSENERVPSLNGRPKLVPRNPSPGRSF